MNHAIMDSGNQGMQRSLGDVMVHDGMQGAVPARRSGLTRNLLARISLTARPIEVY
jgi:hypothetical protein